MPLSAGKKIEQRTGDQFAHPLKALAVVHQGGLAMLNAGVLERARPGAGATAADQAAEAGLCRVIGIAEKSGQGGATNGAVRLPVKAGTFLFKNSAAADALTLADVGNACFVVDDETVAKTSNANVRPRAGTVVDVESVGVWVRVGPGA